LVIEKERLINMFFNIGRNERTEALKSCRSQCEKFLIQEGSEKINDLIHIINALICYFKTGDKAEPRRWSYHILTNLYFKTRPFTL